MADGTATTDELSDAPAATATSPDGDTTTRATRRRRWAVVGLLTVLVSLAALGAAVTYEWQQMQLITSEVCGSPRTSWVPFLHIDLVSCISW